MKSPFANIKYSACKHGTLKDPLGIEAEYSIRCSVIKRVNAYKCNLCIVDKICVFNTQKKTINFGSLFIAMINKDPNFSPNAGIRTNYM